MPHQHLALIPAAGIGQRFNAATGSQIPKQYASLAGKPMLLHTVQALLNFAAFTQVLVVVSPDDAYATHCLADVLQRYPKRLILSFAGGDTRAATVRNGLTYFEVAGFPHDAWIWVHDAARPAIELAQLHALEHALHAQPVPVGVLLAIPVADTLKRGEFININNDSKVKQNLVVETMPRQNIWQAQTPQCFGLKVLAHALDAAAVANVSVTDEASAIEFIGKKPVIIAGGAYNFKVTHPEDAVLMAAILSLI